MAKLDIDKILNVYNYFDGVIITDAHGVIQYYTNLRKDLYDLKMDQIIGKTVLEIHPDMTEQGSSILTVLKTGKPIWDWVERLTTPHGQTITNLCHTLPLLQDGKIIGAIDLSRCVDEGQQRQNVFLERNQTEKETQLYHLEDIMTTSVEMNGIKNKIPNLANTDSSIMIYGETGTGKELVAQAIHTASNRASKRFVSQNCAAIPSGLLESILFGSVKGSYTGAENRAGLFETASGGTLFLDEINSMDMSMQAKILKAIEEKKITRLGDTVSRYFDVKIISAVNEDPLVCVNEKRLREDLFYRLNTVHLRIPPLRERLADIQFLTDCFIKKFNVKMNMSVLGISHVVSRIFAEYSWPGNVRELQNVIEGAFNVIGSRFIEEWDLPQYLTRKFQKAQELLDAQDQNMSLQEKLELYEKRLIVKALDDSGSITEAAGKLRLSKQALNYKLLKYGLRIKET